MFFCLFQSFAEKEYQTESKWNETFTMLFLGPKTIQKTWSRSLELHEEATRQEGAPRGVGVPPPSWAPRSSTDVLLSPIYTLIPQKHQGDPQNHFSTAATFCTVRSHLGTFSRNLPEGESIMEGFYINTIASPMNVSSLPHTFGYIVISQMASSLSSVLNTKFSSMFSEIYSM